MTICIFAYQIKNMKDRPKSYSFRSMKRKLFLMGFLKIPMLGRLHPTLLQIDDETVQLKIKLRRRSKNHLNSMYFGAMAVGADCAAGLHAFYFAEKHGKKISFVFKSMSADFLKRVMTDAIFTFSGGKEIEAIIRKSIETGERYNHECKVVVTNSEGEEVAIFTMEASVKVV